ncbi:PAS domain-containing protein [Sphingomonas sp. FW199]|uniref:hybrid sensor histidine kinase/response regulator n=1 Tax=Sphingomonas sp. FW199 TaxID=3400217 RepID=UPI003CF70ADB
MRFLDHGGDMAQRIRAIDWSSTSLGPIEHWPQALRITLGLALGSTFPTAIYWGPDLRLLYNDAWAFIPGDRHPDCIGMPAAQVWHDIWDAIEPQFRIVLETGEGFSTFDQLLMLERGGVPTETYWNYSLTPIRDDSGNIVGIFNQGNETTEQVLMRRRRSSEIERLRDLFEQAPGAIAILSGPDHVFEIANQAYFELVGRSAIIGMPVAAALPEVAEQGFVAILDQVYATGIPYRAERTPVTLQRGPDQQPEERTLDFVFQPVRGADGQVTGIFIQAQDITDRAAAERTARENASNLEAAIRTRSFLADLDARLRSARDPATVLEITVAATGNQVQADRAGMIRPGNAGSLDFVSCWTNGALPPLLGPIPSDILSGPVLDRFRSGQVVAIRNAAMEPEHAETRTARMSPAGIAVPLMRNGQWVASLYVSSAQPRDWTEDEIALLLAVAETSWDAVERAEAVEALRESEAKFRAIANSIDPMVWSTRADGHHDYFNDRWYDFTGVPAGSTDGAGWSDLFHPDDQPRAWERWRHSLDTGAPYRIEYRLRHRSGTYRWVLGRAAPVRDDQGRITRWFGTCTDIQEIVDAREVLARSREDLERLIEERTRQLMAAEEQLRQAQKMEAVGQLTGGIAHDFNNMLAVVIGGLDLLERRLATGERDVGRYVQAARDGAERAAALTQRLLAFARRSPLAPKLIDPGALIAGMTDMLNRTLGETVRVRTQLGRNLWPALADPGELENALLNLCVNARDAMPGGGTVTLACANSTLDAAAADLWQVTPGDYIELAVADTGSGMAPEVIERAFEPFFTTKAVGKGTGLGLSQIFGFARQSGGSVRIESALGQGTRVVLILPRAPLGTVASGRDAGPADPAAMPMAIPGESVLLVEDEQRVRSLSLDALVSLGYRVHEATDGRTALALIESGLRPSLLFTDMVMPDMGGRALAAAAVEHLPGLPVLFTSGYDRDAVEPGGDGPWGETRLLAKPFGIVELARALRATLDAAAERGVDASAPSA